MMTDCPAIATITAERLRKAWRAKVPWSDSSDFIYGSTAAKARYVFWLEIRDPCPDCTLMQISVRRAPEYDVLLPPVHRLVPDLPKPIREMVEHAYGAQHPGSPGYRDHFCTAPGDLNALRAAWEFGLFTGPHGESAYGETPDWSGAFFYLTALGKDVARSLIPTYPGERVNS